ncbi:hypothetical protein C5167_037124 [Papaver somniferum]|uniref:Uncharacterized protein n=1 Tax=Papaver somniferum TaxID=3469 RepID=A0A4Y7I9L0_PAPSO|nr:hypothetical protein C5167_037124 [Papaver somniferum]
MELANSGSLPCIKQQFSFVLRFSCNAIRRYRLVNRDRQS